MRESIIENFITLNNTFLAIYKLPIQRSRSFIFIFFLSFSFFRFAFFYTVVIFRCFVVTDMLACWSCGWETKHRKKLNDYLFSARHNLLVTSLYARFRVRLLRVNRIISKMNERRRNWKKGNEERRESWDFLIRFDD